MEEPTFEIQNNNSSCEQLSRFDQYDKFSLL